MKQTFYSNGKLLITGEYLVLDGATAFAFPTKFGQNLVVESTKTGFISWKSFDSDKNCWFKTEITFDEIIKKKMSNESQKIKNTLIEILYEAYKLNPNLISNSKGFEVKTELTFPKNWGLGTSSTLVNNIAQWFQIDAFELLKNSFGGSGYDIACAQNNTPILYKIDNQKPIVTTISFNEDFKKNIYFLYLNKKQNSKTAIENYYNKRGEISEIISKINHLTEIISTTNDLETFKNALKIHETELSFVLEQNTIKEQLFPDFDGTIKSLGAWGGDFVIIVSNENPSSYFALKGYTTILKFSEIIL